MSVINADIRNEEMKRIIRNNIKEVNDIGKLKLYGSGIKKAMIIIGKHLSVTEDNLEDRILMNHII